MSLDLLSEEGAQRLVNNIQRYWKKQGHSVKAWVDKTTLRVDQMTGEPVVVYEVRSNLLNGWPRPHAAAAS
jgi:hypothetical protein